MTDLSYPQSSGSNSLVFVGIGIILLLVLVVAVAWIFTGGGDFVKGLRGEDEVVESFGFNLGVVDSQTDRRVYGLSYELVGNQEIVQTGLFKEGVVETFSRGVNDTNYTFKVFGPDFYPNKRICHKRTSECVIVVEKMGDVSVNLAELDTKLFLLTYYVKSGMIKTPVLCTSWSGLINLQLDNKLQAPFIPPHLITKVDKCFSLEKDLGLGLHQYNISVNPSTNKYSFVVGLYDKCEGNFEGCVKDIKVRFSN